MDLVRKLALSVNKNSNAFALVNIDNGWAMYGSKDTFHAVIPSTKVPNGDYLLSDNATLRAMISYYLNEATQIVEPQIPENKTVIYSNNNQLDLLFFIRALQSPSMALYFNMNYPQWQLLKVPTYQNVIDNTGDLFTAVQNMGIKTGSLLDLPRALYSRMPPVFAYGLSKLFYQLVGTPAGFLDGTQLQLQMVSLLQLIPGANQIKLIEIGHDRTWSIYTADNNVHHITSTGLVYSSNGTLVDSVTTSQSGSVLGISVYDKSSLNTTFPGESSSNSNSNNPFSFLGPFSSFFNIFGNAMQITV